MKLQAFVFTYICIGIMCVPSFVSANTLAPIYTNESYFTLSHEKPARFYADGDGGFYGFTETNRPFYQRNIVNTLSIRLQRFQIDEAFFYITDKGVIYADNDIAALSMYLSRA